MFIGHMISAFLLSASSAQAHREDYLDETLVFETIERGDVEPELWVDVGATGGKRVNEARSHLALEYGITNHWMVDTRWTVERVSGGPTRLAGGRFENRARLKEEGEWPVDIAGSFELNGERGAGGDIEWGMEPRLVLSKDAGSLNVTANAAEEVLFGGGGPRLNIAIGVRRGKDPDRVRFGAEAKWEPVVHLGSLFPQVWIVLWEGGTFKFGYSEGLGRNPERFGRMVLEAEL